MFSILI